MLRPAARCFGRKSPFLESRCGHWGQIRRKVFPYVSMCGYLTDVTVTATEYSHIPQNIIALIVYKFVITLLHIVFTLSIVGADHKWITNRDLSLYRNIVESVWFCWQYQHDTSVSGVRGSQKGTCTITVLVTAIAFLPASTARSILVIGTVLLHLRSMLKPATLLRWAVMRQKVELLVRRVVF